MRCNRGVADEAVDQGANTSPTPPFARTASPETCERSISLNRTAAEAFAGDHHALSKLLARLHPRVVLYYRARLLGTPVATFADDLAHQCTLDVVTRMSDTISADTRIETFAYELASRRIASIPQSRNIDGQFKRPRRLTDDQREVLVLRIAVGLTAEMTASTLRTTRSSVLLVQHQALRAWTVSERS